MPGHVVADPHLGIGEVLTLHGRVALCRFGSRKRLTEVFWLKGPVTRYKAGDVVRVPKGFAKRHSWKRRTATVVRTFGSSIYLLKPHGVQMPVDSLLAEPLASKPTRWDRLRLWLDRRIAR